MSAEVWAAIFIGMIGVFSTIITVVLKRNNRDSDVFSSTRKPGNNSKLFNPKTQCPAHSGLVAENKAARDERTAIKGRLEDFRTDIVSIFQKQEEMSVTQATMAGKQDVMVTTLNSINSTVNELKTRRRDDRT